MHSDDPQTALESYRDEISAIDRQIFNLVKKREQLSAKIGQVKRGLFIPDRDFAREKAVFLNALAMAKELELPEKFAIALQKLIVENSLSRQERDRIKTSSSNNSLSVLVIGAGRLGQWLCAFFADSGHKVSIIDKINPHLPYAYADRLDASANDHDLIVVATPIRVSAEILAEIGQLALKNPVIFDVSSVKAPVHAALTKLAHEGFKVSSIHPMFGPSVQLLFGKHVIITSLGVKKADDLARNLFKATSLRIIDMSLEQHDKTMASLLSLSHVINIIFVATLHKSGIDINFLEGLASPTFSNVLTTARKVFDENPHLYYEIQALNPHNNQCYSALFSSLKYLLKTINNLKEEGFVALMNEGKAYLSKAS